VRKASKKRENFGGENKEGEDRIKDDIRRQREKEAKRA
jgi:hypothetical protein